MVQIDREQNANPVRIEVKGKGPYIARVVNPELELAQEKADSLSARFLVSGSQVLDELDQEVADMPIATRFSPTRQLKENLYRGHKTTHEEATEAEAKRMQLESNLKSIRYLQNLLAARLSQVIMDIEATKIED